MTLATRQRFDDIDDSWVLKIYSETLQYIGVSIIYVEYFYKFIVIIVDVTSS